MVEKIKGFLLELLTNPKEAIRSALTTAVAVSGALVLAGQYVNVPAEVTVAVAAVVTALRTLLAAVDGKNKSFGRGSK
jgi:hypothetical protein